MNEPQVAFPYQVAHVESLRLGIYLALAAARGSLLILSGDIDRIASSMPGTIGRHSGPLEPLLAAGAASGDAALRDQGKRRDRRALACQLLQSLVVAGARESFEPSDVRDQQLVRRAWNMAAAMQEQEEAADLLDQVKPESGA